RKWLCHGVSGEGEPAGQPQRQARQAPPITAGGTAANRHLLTRATWNPCQGFCTVLPRIGCHRFGTPTLCTNLGFPRLCKGARAQRKRTPRGVLCVLLCELCAFAR